MGTRGSLARQDTQDSAVHLVTVAIPARVDTQDSQVSLGIRAILESLGTLVFPVMAHLGIQVIRVKPEQTVHRGIRDTVELMPQVNQGTRDFPVSPGIPASPARVDTVDILE